jgi:hypothetical protein
MRSMGVIALGVLLAFTSMAEAATLQGTLHYAGLPVSTTFTTMTSGGAWAYEETSQTWTQGMVDIAGSSYTINGLNPGSYQLTVRLSTHDVGQDNTPSAGDLWVFVSLSVGSETTITNDLDLGYAPHVTQPLDNATTWTGSRNACPAGPEVAKTFTLAWEPVPLATSYKVTIDRWSCTSALASEEVIPAGTSTQITQQTVAGESYMLVKVDAFAGATQITVQPYVAYSDGWSQANIFHAASSQSGRQTHPTNSLFLAQVAHLAGVSPSFWKTDLFLTNPTTSAVTAKVRFTPRDVDGTQTYYESQVDLPASASRTITDVLDTLFGVGGAGSLEVEPATVEVACRNYTPGSGPGLYGQGFLPIGSDQTIWLGGPAQRLGTGGVAKGSYRANLSLTEVWGESVDLLVKLLDRDGAELGEETVSLLPFGTTQINDVVGQLGGPATIAEAQVVVEVASGAGRVGAVLSLVDNGSQDPSTLPLSRR